ncbi:HD domain-containing phosphohydrolase [Chloroflexota bacterium]
MTTSLNMSKKQNKKLQLLYDAASRASLLLQVFKLVKEVPGIAQRMVKGSALSLPAFLNRQRKQNKKLQLLYDVALTASSVSEVFKLIKEIPGIAQHMVKGSASSLLLVDENKEEMFFNAVEGPVKNKLELVKINLNSGIAGWVARNQKPLIVNDVYKDQRFNKDVDKISGFVTESIIAVPIVRGQKTLGVLEILNKQGEDEFDMRDSAILAGFASEEALLLLVSMVHTAINNIKVQEQWLKQYERTVETLAQAIDAKDDYALGHSDWVRKFTMIAANSLSLSPDELQTIEFGALLHDIGKISINEDILGKTETLSDKEWDIIHKHPVTGAEIAGGIPFLEKAKDIILYHHERFDGKGYPEGLKGEAIPIGARLVAVADAFDTMVTGHSYRSALTVKEAVNELIAGSGTQFCPLAVDTFISAFKKENIKPAEKETDTTAKEDIGVSEGEAKKYNNVDEDIHDTNRATKVKQRHTGTWLDKGYASLDTGSYSEAITFFGKALEINPDNDDAWLGKGNALTEQGKYQKAITCFDVALSLNSNNATAWDGKGYALDKQDKYAESLACFEKATNIEPGNSLAWYNKGVALRKLSQYEAALTCFNKALKINPGFSEVLQNREYILEAMGKDHSVSILEKEPHMGKKK